MKSLQFSYFFIFDIVFMFQSNESIVLFGLFVLKSKTGKEMGFGKWCVRHFGEHIYVVNGVINTHQSHFEIPLSLLPGWVLIVLQISGAFISSRNPLKFPGRDVFPVTALHIFLSHHSLHHIIWMLKIFLHVMTSIICVAHVECLINVSLIKM